MKNDSHNMLILASGSKLRQLALKTAKIPFKAVASDIDETLIESIDIKDRVIKTAKAKVLEVAKKHQGLILGADGMNVVNGKIFGKPKDKKEATRMIQAQSGSTSTFYTGYYIINTKTGQSYQGLTESKYRFRILSDDEIKKYVDSESVTSWAAAFSPISSSGIKFTEWMEGSISQFCYSMPFDKIIPILKREKIV
jgi:7-methyl-GTP pyrophosphatase